MYYSQNSNSLEKKSKYDQTKEELSIFIRDFLHNMDLSDSMNVNIYNFYKMEYIATFEGRELNAYDDAVGPNHPYKYANKIFAAGRTPFGKITVGAGFNMDRPEAKAEWKKIFGDEISFDEVYYGKIKISDPQLKKLLKFSVDPRERELKNYYKEVWGKLRANERIVILSAYYNGPALVKPGTRFFTNIKKYTETSDPKYLKEAVIELGERSKKDPQLIPRRELEAMVLDSTKLPFYVKPNENVIPNGPLKIILGKTKVPIGIERVVPVLKESDFFIWRTKLDDRVRTKHFEHEGMVYSKSEMEKRGELTPNQLRYKGCRCEEAPVPSKLLIMNKNNEIVSLDSWIRYSVRRSTFII